MMLLKLCTTGVKFCLVIQQCYSIMFFISAVDAGICIAMEFGLDPGIDHMLAVQCFDEIRSKGGEVSSSYIPLLIEIA